MQSVHRQVNGNANQIRSIEVLISLVRDQGKTRSPGGFDRFLREHGDLQIEPYKAGTNVIIDSKTGARAAFSTSNRHGGLPPWMQVDALKRLREDILRRIEHQARKEVGDKSGAEKRI